MVRFNHSVKKKKKNTISSFPQSGSMVKVGGRVEDLREISLLPGSLEMVTNDGIQ